MSFKSSDESIQGRFYKINKKIKKKITARYHKIKKLGNNPVNDMVAEITGKTAIEIVNTLIREKYISSLQHAADMGIELCKAELALKNDLKYIQDKDLTL